MELTKIRNLSDDELRHQERTSAEQLFRIRLQMATDPSSGVKKLRQLRKEIAQIKTVERERELGIHGESNEAKPAAPAAISKVMPANCLKCPKNRMVIRQTLPSPARFAFGFSPPVVC